MPNGPRSSGCWGRRSLSCRPPPPRWWIGCATRCTPRPATSRWPSGCAPGGWWRITGPWAWGPGRAVRGPRRPGPQRLRARSPARRLRREQRRHRRGLGVQHEQRRHRRGLGVGVQRERRRHRRGLARSSPSKRVRASRRAPPSRRPVPAPLHARSSKRLSAMPTKLAASSLRPSATASAPSWRSVQPTVPTAKRSSALARRTPGSTSCATGSIPEPTSVLPGYDPVKRTFARPSGGRSDAPRP
jgi:hypothetical protein